MSQQIKRTQQPWLRFFFFASISGALELVAVAFIFSWVRFSPINPGLLGVGLHLLSLVFLFFAPPKGLGWFYRERLWAQPFIFPLGWIPFFGWLICIPVFLVAYGKNPLNYIDEDEDAELFQLPLLWRGAFGKHSNIQEKVLEELDFVPLIDILEGDNPELKRGAIERLGQIRDPEAIRALIQHKSDALPEVRFYISSALTRIKNEFDEELEAAKEQMKKDVYKISARLLLARVYLQYANSDLLDEVASRTYKNEAIYHLEYAVKSDFAKLSSLTLLVECLTAMGQWDRALYFIESSSIQRTEFTPGLARLHVEALYRMGKLEELGKLIKSRADAGDAHWVPLAQYWGVA